LSLFNMLFAFCCLLSFYCFGLTAIHDVDRGCGDV
jgi:hypothetical protein